MDAAKTVENLLRAAPCAPADRAKNWRNLGSHYRQSEQCAILPGTVNLSPAWFALGHPVCVMSSYDHSAALNL